MMESEKPIADSADSAPPVATFCVDNTPGTAGKTFFFSSINNIFSLQNMPQWRRYIMIGPLPSAVSEVLGSDCGVKLSYRLR